MTLSISALKISLQTTRLLRCSLYISLWERLWLLLFSSMTESPYSRHRSSLINFMRLYVCLLLLYLRWSSKLTELKMMWLCIALEFICVAITYSYFPCRTSSANRLPISCACSGVTSPYLNDWTMCLAACLPLLPDSRRVCLNSRSAVSREQL